MLGLGSLQMAGVALAAGLVAGSVGGYKLGATLTYKPAYEDGYAQGVSDQQAQQVKESFEQLKKRKEIDANVNNLTDADLCEWAGGVYDETKTTPCSTRGGDGSEAPDAPAED